MNSVKHKSTFGTIRVSILYILSFIKNDPIDKLVRISIVKVCHALDSPIPFAPRINERYVLGAKILNARIVLL